MNALTVLRDLARVALRGQDMGAGLRDAADLIAAEIRAETVYLIYGDDWFRKLGDSGDPQDYDIKQQGYWLLNRFMVDKSNPCAFNLADKQVSDVVAARQGVIRSHAAVLIPMSEGKSEMLIVGGLKGRLRQSDIALLEAAAPIAAHVVARRVDDQRLQRQQQQLNALGDVARVMARSQDKDQVLEEVATAVAGASGFDIVSISVLDPDGKRLASRHLSLQRFSQHPVSQAYKQGLMDESILALANVKEPVLYADLASAQRVDERTRYLLSAKALMASLASFPLLFRNETVGIMSLLSQSPHSFERPEVELLQGLAAQVAMILKGLDMYEELRSAKETLQEHAQRLQESVSIESKLARTDPVTGLSNHRAFHERVREEVSGAQENGKGIGLVMLDIDDFKRVNDSVGHLAGDQVLHELALILVDMVKRKGEPYRYGGDEFAILLPGVKRHDAARVAEGLRRAVAKRMDGNGNKVTISLGVASFPDVVGSAEELIYGADAAMYWAKAGGKNRVGRWDRLVSRGAEGTASWSSTDRAVRAPDVVAALVAALAAKDPVTCAHAERCSWYAVKLAEELGVAEEERVVVRLAALLHDIGKLAVSDTVLFKPGPLTDEEWTQMKQHPSAALHVLSQVRSIAEATPAIVHHHEHFDGSGYPDGLAGEEIPVVARILLVTDAFDAMTTDRPYRKAMPVDAAIEELKRNCGNQFDPRIVSAFLRVLSRHGPQPLDSVAQQSKAESAVGVH